MKVKKIDIGIKGLRESLKEFADTWKSLEAGRIRPGSGLNNQQDSSLRLQEWGSNLYS
jgi:hypothetical protein